MGNNGVVKRYSVYEVLTEKQAFRIEDRFGVVYRIEGRPCRGIAWGITEDMRSMYTGKKYLVREKESA